MNTPTYATRSSHNLNDSGGWLPRLKSPSLIDDRIFQWPTVPDYATSAEERSALFSSFPSSSTSPVQPVALPPTDLIAFSTLPSLLTTLLNVAKWSRDCQLSNDHLRVATTWISNRFQTVSDIPEEEFNRYTDKWRVIAGDIRDMGEVPDPIKVVIHKAIPRPCNSFFFFKRAAIGKLHTGLASQLWKALPKSSIQVWKMAANKLDGLHKEIFPEYKFRPTHDVAKRKTKGRVRAQAEIQKSDTIASGEMKKRASKSYTIPSKQYPELSQISNEPSNEPMNWPGYANPFI
ncbi:hypothetical protein BDZ94DRAFT_1324915 [Collybia nuda]|uniref:Uncharacterized protein n=1 Tax=Collybia nuda TaxID=64659 RepID=A0A9P5XZ44_9AGAR|nr:hypothetical protein BDZ94DRAFT_1324915 [Collybia nuda]